MRLTLLEPHPLTIAGTLALGAADSPDHIALLAPNRAPTSYKALYEQVISTVERLNQLGFGRNDRIALIVPNGPELAVGLLSVASATACLALDPHSPQREVESLFNRIGIQALIYQSSPSGEHLAALAAAQSCRIPVIELLPSEKSQAGIFTLSGQAVSRSIEAGFAQPDDIALINFTSGTTSAVKIVPILHSTLIHRNHFALDLLGLHETDRLLSVAPLHHSSGQGQLMRAFGSGGSLVSMSGFEVDSFFKAIDEFRPTWLSPVATVAQSIVDHAPSYPEIIKRHSLRFMRCGSMALPPKLMLALEQLFNIPILQAYSSTEAGMTAIIPLPPYVRKLGSVGRVIPQSNVLIVDEADRSLPTGETGEIIVSGLSVFNGYIDDAEATERALRNGFYHTGDLGYFDQDGDLFVVGRVKETINRGGQKIAPSEVESVLQQHPAVEHVAVFGIPSKMLGEEVGAVVVLYPDYTVDESTLQGFVSQHLAVHKIPRRIVFVPEIPTNRVGKYERRRLAEQLNIGLDSPVESNTSAAPRTPTESTLITLWAETLHIPQENINIHTRFQDVGGVSLSAARLIFRVRAVFKLDVTIVDFFNAATIATQAEVLERLKISANRPSTTLIPIRAEGSRPPLFCLPPLRGGVYTYIGLLPFLHPDQPVYGLQAIGIDDGKAPLESVDEMVDHHLKMLLTVQNKGPFFLCGYSFGGRLALEVGRRLRQDGHQDVYVLMIDDRIHTGQDKSIHSSLIQKMLLRLTNLGFALLKLPLRYRLRYLYERGLVIWWHFRPPTTAKRIKAHVEAEDKTLPETIFKVMEATKKINYRPKPYDGPVVFLRARGELISIPMFKRLYTLAVGPLKVVEIPGIHYELMRNPVCIARIGNEMQHWLDNPNQK